MTKKRFKLDSEVGFIDTQGGEDTMTLFEVVVELNKLDEENEQLKKSVKRQQGSNNECAKLIEKQQKENEQLKELMKDLKHEYDSLHDVCSKLEKKVKCIQEEANDYCEELMGKDEFIRLYKRQRDEFIEENEQLKKENELLKQDFEHCANQFTDEGKNVLLELK